MASIQNALICAGLATVLWTCIGLSISSRLVPPSLALPIAPTLGWAIHSVIAFPVFCATGMSRTTVILLVVLSMIGAVIALPRRSLSFGNNAQDRLSLWAIAGAAILALAFMAMVLPQTSADGVTLADVIFDHSKVAIIDDMARSGVPAGNPFFGERDGLDRLSYYYLWHFSAAELAILTGYGGWDADAGLTCFTAFSSLTLMMGLARWVSGRRAAANWVMLLALAASIRPIVSMLLGTKVTNAVTGWPTGFGGWLFQMSWAPQHMASAGCVVIAIFLLIQLAQRQSISATIVFSLVAAAAFQSSTWIGGVTFPLAAATIGAVLLAKIDPGDRLRFILGVTGAAALAIVIASPFIYDQFRASMVRSNGSPIGVIPYDVLGDEIHETVRLIFDLPVYWTVFLFVELAAIYPVGLIMMTWLSKDPLLPNERKASVRSLGLLLIISLAVGSVLASKLGGNNDLGWRGVLPGIMILIVFTAAGLSSYLRRIPMLYKVGVLGIIALSSFAGIRSICDQICFQSKLPSLQFVDAARMWSAVRKHSNKDERVANNPLFLSDMTNWPINISWALMANRRSCYAGSGFWPFAPRTKLPLDEIDTQFERVFSGHPAANDLDQLAGQYHCSVVVVASHDGAWTQDPFGSSPLYQLVELEPNLWRIYRMKSDLKK
jgi:hypothetical protein